MRFIAGSRLFGLLCSLSGCLWACVGYLLAREVYGASIVGGVLAAPLIGLLAGYLFRPAYGLRWPWQLVVALVTLYVAVSLFAAAAGVFDAARVGTAQGNLSLVIPGEVVLQFVVATLYGVTLSGYVLVLWPLAFLNHRVLKPFAA